MEPTRAEIDASRGGVVLEFGAEWCGICHQTKPAIEKAVAAHPGVRHIRVEDGSGRPLGRSFGVKLWPTIVVLRDGVEVARLVRPRSVAEIKEAVSHAAAGPPSMNA